MDQHLYDRLFYLLPILGSLMLALGLAILAYRRRHIPGGFLFAIFLLAEASWIGGYILELLSPSLEGKIFWDDFQFIGTFMAPVIALWFTFQFCNVKSKISTETKLAMAVPILILTILVYTNPWHHLVMLDQRLIPDHLFGEYAYTYGIPFYMGVVYTYFLSLWSIYLLLNLVSRQSGVYRLQTSFILIGYIIPVAGSILTLVDLPFFPQRDISPYYFAIANLFIAYGLFRLRIFDIVPIGRSLAMDHMHDGLLIVDAAGRLVDINKAACTLMKQPGLTASAQLIQTLPEGWGSLLKFENSDPAARVKEFSCGEGADAQYFELSTTPIHDQYDHFLGYILILHDISIQKKSELVLQTAYNELEQRVQERTRELAQSEIRYRSIIEQTSDGFVLIDHNGIILEANPMFEHICAIPLQEVIGHYAWEVQARLSGSPEREERAKKLILDIVQNPGRNTETELIEIPIKIREGQNKTIQFLVFPIEVENITRIGIFIRDITDLKQAQASLQKLNNELENRVAERTAQLEAVNKELEAFSYSVSHDLRAPLRRVSGFAAMLEEDLGSSLSLENRDHLQRIVTNVGYMEALINALLIFSRMERQSLNLQLVQPGDVIRQAWDEVSRELGGRQVSIEINDPPACQADPLLLKQVYINLLSNAVKYTRPQPEAKIWVGWQEQDGVVVYFIRDNGVGFDMAQAGRLFSIFQRLHSEEQFEGIGIGLSTVQRIITRHGGRIWAEAAPNQGACFYFTLSLARNTH
ncbi:MAG TPA: histidine kinase N-terminal 7TM domain-containing protein [Anaerolineaceae bacterium]|nr:histidine kinase N-terminal 7TM domain-containing protein [Anaerolineaceae bacterium]